MGIIFNNLLGFLGIPLVFYAARFWGGCCSPDPTHWGVFGDFLNPFIGILNIAVVGYLAFLVNHYQRDEDKIALRRERQLALACDLLREWNSETMYAARTTGYDTLKRLPFVSLKELDTAHSEALVHVWIVIGFFQRLEILQAHEQLAGQTIADMFGQIFTWWDIVCFQPQLADSWESHLRITRLRESIESCASQEDLERWLREAQAEREIRDKEASLLTVD